MTSQNTGEPVLPGKRVYVAGPYTRPDPYKNTVYALKMADLILDLGGVPYVPHLSHFWNIEGKEKPYEFWLSYDLVWLAQCQCVYRFPGFSLGADREVKYAKMLGIPVFTSIISLRRFLKDGSLRA